MAESDIAERGRRAASLREGAFCQGNPADMAQIRQSRLDYGLVFQIKVLHTLLRCVLFARKWPAEPMGSTFNQLVHQWSRCIRRGGLTGHSRKMRSPPAGWRSPAATPPSTSAARTSSPQRLRPGKKTRHQRQFVLPAFSNKNDGVILRWSTNNIVSASHNPSLLHRAQMPGVEKHRTWLLLQRSCDRRTLQMAACVLACESEMGFQTCRAYPPFLGRCTN